MNVGFQWERQKERDRYEEIRRREDNIKVDYREIRLSGADWIQLSRDRNQGKALVNTV